MAGRGRNTELDPINLTPLLDCILNLIFFFLLATTVKTSSQVMEVQLPQSGVGVTPIKVPKEIVVTIVSNGSIFYDNDAVTSAQLKARLAKAVKEPSGPVPIRIRSDRDARVQALYDVVSIFRESGHPNFQWETKPFGRAP
jgi:biopolymer transport protein ExbD